jgi:hypothetical protein
LDVISRGTAAMYVTLCSIMDPCSHIIILITASAGHQGSTGLGWYRSKEVTFVCLRITLYFDLPAEITKPVVQLWAVLSHKNTNITGRICGTFYL